VRIQTTSQEYGAKASGSESPQNAVSMASLQFVPGLKRTNGDIVDNAASCGSRVEEIVSPPTTCPTPCSADLNVRRIRF